MNAWRPFAAVIAVVASALVTVGAQVRSEPYSGNADYMAYCTACHGPEGRGDGTLAKSLKKRPADLTLLTKGNNGTFPKQRVVKSIDGSEPGSAHGNSDMPTWGDVLAKSSASPGAENAAARIGVLVAYLETLQAR